MIVRVLPLSALIGALGAPVDALDTAAPLDAPEGACQCTATDGYIAALEETKVHVANVPIDENLSVAVVQHINADRARIIAGIDKRLSDFAPEPEPEQDEQTTVLHMLNLDPQAFGAALTALGYVKAA